MSLFFGSTLPLSSPTLLFQRVLSFIELMLECLFYQDSHLSFGRELIRLTYKFSKQIRKLSVPKHFRIRFNRTLFDGLQEILRVLLENHAFVLCVQHLPGAVYPQNPHEDFMVEFPEVFLERFNINGLLRLVFDQRRGLLLLEDNFDELSHLAFA